MTSERALPLWTATLIAALILPPVLFTAVIPITTAGRRWADVTGLLAVAFLVVSLALPARLRGLSSVVGHGLLIRLHRLFAWFAVLAVLTHLGTLYAIDPSGTVERLNVPSAPTAGRAAVIATVALLLLPFVIRQPRARTTNDRRVSPDTRRRVHAGLALVALVASAVHVVTLSHLFDVPAFRVLFLGYASAAVILLGHRYVVIPLRGARRRYHVGDVTTDPANRMTTVTLVPDHGRHARVDAAPGQFAYVRAAHRERPYTVTSPSTSPELRIVTRPTSNLGRVTPGDRVRVDVGYGALDRATAGSGVVTLTSGVGITPALAIMRGLAAQQDPRHHYVFIAARGRDDLLFFRTELERLGLAHLHLHYEPVQPHPHTLGALETFLPPEPERSTMSYVVCGPPAFVRATLIRLAQLSIPQGRVHTETLPEKMPHPSSPEIPATRRSPP